MYLKLPGEDQSSKWKVEITGPNQILEFIFIYITCIIDITKKLKHNMVKQWEPRENSYIFEKSKSRENENY